jgi:hypothetical protein
VFIYFVGGHACITTQFLDTGTARIGRGDARGVAVGPRKASASSMTSLSSQLKNWCRRVASTSA